MCPNVTFPMVYELMSDIAGMGDVVEYFITTWAPAVVQLHTLGGGILATFLVDLYTELEKLYLCEV